MINRFGPFIIEIFLGIILGCLFGNYCELSAIYNWLKTNYAQVLSVYAILIGVSATFTGQIFNENDIDFVKFLISANAEQWYRLASIFNLSCFLLGAISTLLVPTFEQKNILIWITLSIIGINLIQIYSTLVLMSNYTSLKRKFQNFH